MRILFMLLLGFSTNSICAQWNNNPTINNPLSVMAGTQYAPSILDDGNGGAIIAWNDDRNGNSDIYAQRIDAGGNVLWTTNGIAVCNASGQQSFPQLVSDGAGGAILIWNDLRNDPGTYSNYDVYMQRIDAGGNALWATNGIAVCTAANNQNNPNLVAFATNFLVTWGDNRNSTSNSDLYGQLVDANGGVIWAANGIAINSSAGNQINPKALYDGTNVIVTWSDERSGNYDIYAQRLDGNGNRLWTSTGVAICVAAGWQADQLLVSDGTGGAIITWEDGRPGTPTDVYAQRINDAGIAQWTTNGVVVSNASNSQDDPKIISDGAGGAIISWQDLRNDPGFANRDIYAQRINGNGIAQWTPNGTAICVTSGQQQFQQMVSDGSGGAMITWKDQRSGNWDVYAQRVSAAGIVSWTVNGKAVSIAANNQEDAKIIASTSGSVIITWQDMRNGVDRDIYASKVNADGTLPVKLLKFRGLVSPSGNTLQWVVDNEANMKSYEVEYSFDGRMFQTAGTVLAVQNNTGRKTYVFNHKLESISTYYRLKQIELNGSPNYSDVILLQRKVNSLLRFYPNPVFDRISVQTPQAGEQLVLSSLGGSVLKVFTTEKNYTSFSVGTLPEGVYLLQTGELKALFIKQ